MRPFTRASVIGALALAMAACNAEPVPEPPPDQGTVTIDDVLFAGHGALFDVNGDYLAVDLPMAAALQESLLEALLEGGAPENADRIRVILADARDANLTETDLFVLRDMLIVWRLALVDVSFVAAYQTIAIGLHQVTEALLLISMRGYFWANPTLNQLVGVEIVHYHEMMFPEPQPGLKLASYEDRCRGLEVPVPPPLTNPDWDRLLTAQSPLYLPSFLARVRVYGGENPAGTCISLERVEVGGEDAVATTGQVGVICQNAENGQACFWDGRGEAYLDLEMTEFVDGDVLAENCTNCHRGQNAFLIFPGTPLDVSATHDIDSQVWYQPVSLQQGWVNPEPIVEDGPCVACHDLPGVFREDDPAMGSDYCSLLRWAANNVMPTASAPAGAAAMWSGHPPLDAACNP